ncbi:hypothetical protein HG569_03380 [Helicobacter pylori]|nr:hypothetical protein HG569_03380 [Helicobacter pylori]
MEAKAKESDNAIYSMDDAEIFGEEIYTLNFERAIALDLSHRLQSHDFSGAKRKFKRRY